MRGNPGHDVGTTDILLNCQKKHRQNELPGQVDISYQGGSPCDGGSWTYAGTTDVSPPVKNNTDRMTQLVR